MRRFPKPKPFALLRVTPRERELLIEALLCAAEAHHREAMLAPLGSRQEQLEIKICEQLSDLLNVIYAIRF